jgi:DNA repair protein SbcD/Mre11
MRIIHFSDTHLGYSDYSKFDSTIGINQRERDTYNVFREIIDYIIKTKPDLVIHAGDLFDNIRPSNRSITEALDQFWRLSKEGIPTVVIAGNHSTPRQRTTDPIFNILKYFQNIHPIYEGKYQKLIIGNCAIHAVPHMYSDEDLKDAVSKLHPDESMKYNIMVAHAAVKGSEVVSWGEFKEQTLPVSSLRSDFDYIALGHYHRFLKLRDNAYYCGSPERFSFNEVGDKKGFLEVELDNFSVKPIPTNARDMIIFKPIDCSKLSSVEILQVLESTISGKIDGKIVKVIFNNIPRHVWPSLDFQKIRELVSGAVHYDPVYNWKNDGGTGIGGTSSIGTLDAEFETYLRKLNLPDEEFKTMKALGLEYFGKIVEEVSID